jgi:putative endonuclease
VATVEKIFCVYMLSNKWRGTIYTGMSGRLPSRGFEHKQGIGGKFVSKYKLTRLVYYEVHATAAEAAHREKCIKEWKREWKIQLIESANPEWKDLFDEICK